MRASLLLLGVVLATAACKSARYDECAVRCGAAARPCPATLTCGGDGYCHAAGETRDCSPRDMNVGDLAVAPDLASPENRRPCLTPSDCPAGDQCRCGFCAVPDATCNRSLQRYRLVDASTAGPCVAGVLSVAAQVYHGCLVKTDGTVFCWGLDADGQLGPVDLGTTCGGGLACSLLPIQVRDANGFPFDRVRAVTVGAAHTCALRDDGTVWCWGSGLRLGAGPLPTPTAPVQVVTESGTLTSVVEVSAGYTTTCARRDNGEVYCWGDNSYEQAGAPLDAGVTIHKARKVAALVNAKSIDVGSGHACAVTGSAPSTTWCWGRNNLAQLGNGATGAPPTTSVPSKVIDTTSAPVGNIIEVGAGNHYTCGMTTANTPVVCWGENRNGALGDGTMNTAQRATPVNLAPSDVTAGYYQLRGGDDHTCILLGGNVLKCWGGNQSGQLGVPDAGASSTTPVLTATDVVQVSLGFKSSCALRGSSNEVHCWGANDQGNLGDGTATGHAVPKPIAPACP